MAGRIGERSTSPAGLPDRQQARSRWSFLGGRVVHILMGAWLCLTALLLALAWKGKSCWYTPGLLGLHRAALVKQQQRKGGGVPAVTAPPSGAGLPRIIHQSWKTKELPERFNHMAGTFKEKNPHFAYTLWDDEANEALMLEHYPWFRYTWDSFPRVIYRVDAVRAMYLHRYGGLYFDLDFWCLRPLEQAVSGLSGVVLGYMSDDHTYAHSVPNAFMGSDPGQPFWLFFLSRIMHHSAQAQSEGPEAITGPVGLFHAVNEWIKLCDERGVPHNVTVMDRKVWYINDWHAKGDWWNTERLPDKHCTPKHFELEQCAESFPEALTCTLWTHTWEERP